MFYSRFYNKDKNRQKAEYIASGNNLSSNLNYNSINSQPIQGSISKYVNASGEQQNAEKPSLTGTYNAVKNVKGYFNGGSGAGASGGGAPWGAIASGVKTGYDTLFDKKDENGYDDYSDFEQTMIYPGMGAAYGSSFGPWGALGGAAYGLGYSFKDDIGLDDNNWLTTLIFPIGMGDEHEGLISL